VELFERIRQAQERWNVLRHPFYERWEEGALSREELQTYAGQYRHAVAAVASAARHAATLGDYGHAAEEATHVTLWDAWAASLGAGRAEPSAETVECVERWTPRDPLAATAVLYAVESAQPAIAETKLQGLLEHYGYRADSPALSYFSIHAERDHEHAARAETILRERPPDADDDALAEAAAEAVRANWVLLDGVERLNGRYAAIAPSSVSSRCLRSSPPP
jgi:pyrroloquinoline-quinone synthase